MVCLIEHLAQTGVRRRRCHCFRINSLPPNDSAELVVWLSISVVSFDVNTLVSFSPKLCSWLFWLSGTLSVILLKSSSALPLCTPWLSSLAHSSRCSIAFTFWAKCESAGTVLSLKFWFFFNLNSTKRKYSGYLQNT